MWRFAMSSFLVWSSALVCLVPLGPARIAHGGEWPASFRQDANLNDVCFVDRLNGWAVGDRGAILKTSDGGETWQLQTNPVDYRLESIHAIDAKHAWAVGGFTAAYTHRPKGVILQTQDGGNTWTLSQNHFLPWLTQIQFIDERRGFAIGFPSAMFPSGVYRTTDAGKHWTPWPGNTLGCVAGHFDSNGPGLVVDQRGRLIRVEPQGLQPMGGDRWTPITQLRLLSGNRVVVCGLQGHVATSIDGGRTWSGMVDREMHWTEFDWRAIDTQNDNIWIAGVPGTRVLYSGDAGASWQMQETGQSLPLSSVDFVDDLHGWAVGSLGTILATRDGGKSWQRQTDTPSRVALMAVATNPSSVPWEFLAQASGGEGFLASVEVLSGPSPSIHDVSTVPIARRLHEATTTVAGTCANMIQAVPLSDPELKLDATQIRQRASDAVGGDSQELLCEYLVRQIRIYRPEMLVIAADRMSSPGAAADTRGLVELAVQRARNQGEFESQIQQGGLQPWNVRLVAGQTHQEIGPVYRVTSNRLALPLGQSVTKLADRARSIMSSRYVPGPDELLFEVAGRQAGGRSRGIPRLFDSATLARGEPMHRADLTLKDNFRQLHQTAQQRRTIESLLRSSEELEAARLQQITQLARKLPRSDQGDLLFQTAYRLSQAQHRTEATELLEQLTGQLPQHALAEASRWQLLVQSASLEGLLHWRVPTDDFSQPATSGLKIKSDGGVQQATFESSQADDLPEDQRVSLSQRQTQRAERFARLARAIQAAQPDLYFEPMIRFPVAALHRRLGRTDEATSFWRTQAAKQSDPIWKARAVAELALAKPNSDPTSMTHICRVTEQRPYLDGKLDEDAWSAAPMTLLGDRYAKQVSTKVYWAWDAQFLFIAAACVHPTAVDHAPQSGERRRDVDLSQHDRLTLRLDIDRDYATHWKLSVDVNGSANDALNHDASWNPKWFLDTSSDHLRWAFEVAIPWDQISPAPPQPGDVWAIGVDRLMPGLGRQGWGQAEQRDSDRQQVGLLIFQ